MSLLRNGEEKFIKKTCKYRMFFTYTVVEASTLCTEDGRKMFYNMFFCVTIRKTISVHTNSHVTLDTFEHHSSRHARR